MKLPVKQLTQSGAVVGQLLSWNGSSWAPTTSLKEVEIDFGSTPTNYKTFTISDASVVSTALVAATQSGNAPTGRSADENEMDYISFNCQAGNAQLTIRARTHDGPVVGKYKVNYQLG